MACFSVSNRSATPDARAPPLPPSPNHTRNDQDAQPGKRQDIFRNDIALTALLRLHARIGVGGVDEADQGETKLPGKANEAQRLAAPFWARHAKVAAHILARIAPLRMSDNHDGAWQNVPDRAIAATFYTLIGRYMGFSTSVSHASLASCGRLSYDSHNTGASLLLPVGVDRKDRNVRCRKRSSLRCWSEQS
jgi:hypothetical protein